MSLLELRWTDLAAVWHPTTADLFCHAQTGGKGWLVLLLVKGNKRRVVPAGFKLVWLRLVLLAGLMGEGGEAKGSDRSLGTRKSSPVKDWILEWKRSTEPNPRVFYLGVCF